MKEYTMNFGLIKPNQEDYYDVDDFNENSDIVDAELMALNNGPVMTAVCTDGSVHSFGLIKKRYSVYGSMSQFVGDLNFN